MIKKHPNISDANFDTLIDIAIKDAELSGYISKDTLKQFFNLFSWVYIQGNTHGAFSENTKLEKFLSRFDLFRFKGESICYSAVLFYQKLSKVVDLRDLETDLIKAVEQGCNKMFVSDDFTYKQLYDMYAMNGGDLSTDFLLFNELFQTSTEKEIKKLSAYSELTKLTNITHLVRPDLAYNLSTKKLNVNFEKECVEKEDKKIYILQDSTFSMKRNENQLKMIKAFILDVSFKNNYQVEWLFVSDRINHRVSYNKSNIDNIDMQFHYSGVFVDTSSILISDEFMGKQVVIITDGTDMFDFPFNTKTKKISVISFLDNINIKDKISKYGRFFKITA